MHHDLRWNLDKHVKELTWAAVLEKDYKSYSFGIGKVGLAIIRGTLEDFEVMTKNAEKFVTDVTGYMEDTGVQVISIGCYAVKLRRFILFA